MTESRTLALTVDGAVVSTLWTEPAGMQAALVLAHGAGAGMRHPFLETVAERLARRGVGTLRFQFPYMEAGRRRPDPPAVAVRAVVTAVEVATTLAGRAPVFAGGKSFGGRMTSRAAADGLLGAARGLVLLGFPLHAPGRESRTRAEHLSDVPMPMLFVQGTRDRLANLELMRQVVHALGSGARLHVVEGGDHGFVVPKRMGRNPTDVLDDIAANIHDWIRKVG
jgi:predicted alpha/beta-hydrolase family hydrolase